VRDEPPPLLLIHSARQHIDPPMFRDHAIVFTALAIRTPTLPNHNRIHAPDPPFWLDD
jgi:hypothetical protein